MRLHDGFFTFLRVLRDEAFFFDHAVMMRMT